MPGLKFFWEANAIFMIVSRSILHQDIQFPKDHILTVYSWVAEIVLSLILLEPTKKGLIWERITVPIRIGKCQLYRFDTNGCQAALHLEWTSVSLCFFGKLPVQAWLLALPKRLMSAVKCFL